MENEIQQNIPTDQPPTQIPTPIATPVPTNRSKIILFILLGLIVISASIFVGIQIGRKQTSDLRSSLILPTITPSVAPKQPTITTPPASPSPKIKIGTLTSISDSENVYTNKKYEFEINLPKNFYITQEEILGNEGDMSAQFYVDLSKYKPEDIPGIEFPGIRIIVGNFSGDLLSYVEENASNNVRGYDPANPPETTKKVMGGKLAYQLLNNYYVVNNGKIYSINNGIEEILFNQIISSFKFTN